VRVTVLIARRAAIEAFHDRSTLALGGFFSLIMPLFLVVTNIRLRMNDDERSGAAMAGYLLLVGLLPTSAAVGSAAGQFAGEFEHGNLTPLLATPASNTAIFAGKVLGAVCPALLFAVIAEISYLGGLALWIDGGIGRLPLGLTIAMLALVLPVAIFAATTASLISSRVRTYNSAQQIAGFALIPIWAVVGVVAFIAADLGAWIMALAVIGVVAADITLLLVGASTWRREEVLARR
jgi:ABC-type Na+ efflux pump permease subunit